MVATIVLASVLCVAPAFGVQEAAPPSGLEGRYAEPYSDPLASDNWFRLKQCDNDFGLTLGHYGVTPGCYVSLALFWSFDDS
jgi:hypothetical protein